MGLASKANLIELSFLTVITIGAIKQSLVHLSSFSMCPSVSSLSSSVCTLSWMCIGILLPFS